MSTDYEDSAERYPDDESAARDARDQRECVERCRPTQTAIYLAVEIDRHERCIERCRREMES
jgi:hypothetical protein